jgi:cytochrome b561
MMLRNTPESWGGVAKTLHWIAAALVFAMLGLGLTKRWLGNFEQGAKWSFCLTAAMMAADQERR